MPITSERRDQITRLMRGEGAQPPAPSAIPSVGDVGQAVSGGIGSLEPARGAGRAARSAAIGGAAALDLPRLVTDPLFLAAGKVAGGLGFEDAQQALQGQAAIPTFAERTRGAIDEATGGEFAPRTDLEAGVDFASELVTGLGAPSFFKKLSIKGSQLLEKATAKKVRTPTSDQVKQLSNQAYDEVERVGGTLRPGFANQFVRLVDSIKPKTVAGNIVGGKGKAAKALEPFKDLKGRRLTLKEIQEVDEELSDIIDGLLDVGRVTKEARKVLQVQTGLRTALDKITPNLVKGGIEGFDALKRGRQLWTVQAKLRDVEKIVSRAQLMNQPSTGIRSGFSSLLNSSKRVKGFSKEEIKLMRKAAKTGLPTEIVNTLASRLPSVIALGSGSPAAAGALRLGSVAAREAAGAAQVGRADAVASEIARGVLPKAATLATPNAITPATAAACALTAPGVVQSGVQEAQQPKPIPFKANPKSRLPADRQQLIHEIMQGGR